MTPLNACLLAIMNNTSLAMRSLHLISQSSHRAPKPRTRNCCVGCRYEIYLGAQFTWKATSQWVSHGLNRALVRASLCVCAMLAVGPLDQISLQTSYDNICLVYQAAQLSHCWPWRSVLAIKYVSSCLFASYSSGSHAQGLVCSTSMGCLTRSEC